MALKPDSPEVGREPPVSYSAAELAGAVNAWCDGHGVAPMNAQIASRISGRNIHYYRSAGLLSAPARGRGRGFGERQLLQLIAIRLLQAQGLPQRRIQELLYGRSLDELRQIRDRGLAERPEPSPREIQFSVPESWQMIPVDDEHLLVNRSGRAIDPEQLRRIREILSGRANA